MFQTRLPRLSCTERAISQEVSNGGQVCGDVEAVGFPVQNVYKMTYGDENATFEPVNGYYVYLSGGFIFFFNFGEVWKVTVLRDLRIIISPVWGFLPFLAHLNFT